MPKLAIAFALVAPVALGQPVAADGPLADLAFLTGCWREGGSGATRLEEVYSDPVGHLMLGYSMFVRDGIPVAHELTRIEATADGIVLVPYPGGERSDHDFRLTSLAGGEAVFEAPEHDYPKRIVYRAHPDGTRTARIDGGAGDERPRLWRLDPVPCPQASPADATAGDDPPRADTAQGSRGRLRRGASGRGDQPAVPAARADVDHHRLDVVGAAPGR